MKTLLTLMLLTLVACDARVYSHEIKGYVEACTAHDGLARISKYITKA